MDVSGESIDKLIVNDIIYAFQSKFGEEWYKNLHRILKPSPLKEIAITHGVSLHRVKQYRAKLMSVGLFYRDLFQTENEGDNENNELFEE